jgi:hypothetical protein
VCASDEKNYDEIEIKKKITRYIQVTCRVSSQNNVKTQTASIYSVIAACSRVRSPCEIGLLLIEVSSVFIGLSLSSLDVWELLVGAGGHTSN